VHVVILCECDRDGAKAARRAKNKRGVGHRDTEATEEDTEKENG
jgi:hypothetical protein